MVGVKYKVQPKDTPISEEKYADQITNCTEFASEYVQVQKQNFVYYTNDYYIGR